MDRAFIDTADDKAIIDNSDLPFPASEWKPDCKTFGMGYDGYGGVCFTTQDHGGEAVFAYLRLNFAYNQPIWKMRVKRLTDCGTVKMVRMSGKIAYDEVLGIINFE